MKLSDITNTETAAIMNEYFKDIAVVGRHQNLYTIQISDTDVPPLGTVQITFDGTTQRLLDAMYALKDEFEDDAYVRKQLQEGQAGVRDLLEEAVFTRTYLDGVCKALAEQLEHENEAVNVLWLSRHEMTDEQTKALEIKGKINVQQIPSTLNEHIEPEIEDVVNNWADIVCVVLPQRLQSEMFRVCSGADTPMLISQTRRRTESSEPIFIGWRQVTECEFNSVVWRGVDAAVHTCKKKVADD